MNSRDINAANWRQHALLDSKEQEILDSFKHHAPDTETIEKIGNIRHALATAAVQIMLNVKPSADRTVALRCCHEAMMNANKSLVLEKKNGASFYDER